MATDSRQIATPLSWLKAEIDRSLALARSALARALRQPAELTSALAACKAPVKQIRGALQMLSLEGAARYCNALEQAVAECARQPARLNQMTAAVMDRSLFALSQFLDDMAKGEPDVPLKLFPLYRDLAEICGRSDVAESELFFPDTSAVPPSARNRPALGAEERVRYVSTCRTHFQRGLVDWLREPSNPQALHAMRSALDALHRIADQLDTPVGLWWAAGGLIDLAGGDAAAAEEAGCKQLLGRLERLMRDVAAGSATDAEDLMREVLYPLALTNAQAPRLAEVRALYRLDLQVPEFCVSGTLEYDQSALAPVLNDMRQRLASIEDAWAKYTAGSSTEIARLRTQTNALKAIARDLGHYRLVRLLDIVALIGAKLPDAYPASNDVLALEMAAALLFMEGMLDHFTSPPADIDQQVAVMVGWLLDAVKPRGAAALGIGAPRDDITQRQQYIEIRAQVAREILANLRAIEQTVDEIARDPAQRERVGTLESRVRQIAGALKMLGLNRANGVLSACLHLMKLSVSSDPTLTRASLEWVADGLSCLGFYLDNVRQGEHPNEDILLGFVRRLSRDDAQPAGSSGWIPAASEQAPAGASGAETPQAAPGRVSLAPPLEIEPRDHTDDLRTVFLQEANDILAALRLAFIRLHEAADDTEAMAEIRRGFHTLKSGARLVGYEALGELAAEIEHSLDVFLSEQRGASTELMILVGEAAEAFETALAALCQGLEADTAAYSRLAELAAALREPEHAAEAEARVEDDAPSDLQPPPLPAEEVGPVVAGAEEISIGPVRLSPILYGIYRRESSELLADVHAGLGQLAQEPVASPLPDSLLRAAHTLCSTASNLGFEAIAELAEAFEAALQRLGKEDAVAQDQLAVLQATAQSLAAMFAQIEQRCAPGRDHVTEQRLRALCAEGFVAAGADERLGEETSNAGRLEPRVLGAFLVEASQLVAQIQRELANWRGQPELEEPPRALSRALHTLKGSARVAGALRIGDLTHALESRLGRAMASDDRSEALFQDLQAEVDIVESCLDEFDALAAGIALHPPRDISSLAHSQAEPAAAGSPNAGVRIHLEGDLLDELVNQSAEISVAGSRIEREVQALRHTLNDLTESVARLRSQLREAQVQADSQVPSQLAAQGRVEPGFDPLELDRYTSLQELTRMMAESVHDVQMIQATLAASAADTEAALALQARVSRGLQRSLLELRSVPFGLLRPRLQRIVRQSARELGREAELQLEGVEIELDRSLLQRLTAPVEHMLRNCLAHGIEPAGARAARGKPSVGRIVVSLKREGIEAVVTVQDDGAGLNPELLRREALRLGLLAPSAEVPEWMLRDLVFAPGLSTAHELTASSGRGIGLDVARTEIAALGGSIDVASTPGQGTSFCIRLPLFSAASQVLLLHAGETIYAIPSGLVAAIEELSALQLDRAYAAGMVTSGALQYPLFSLARLVGTVDRPAESRRHNAVLLLQAGEQRIALHVDAVLRNQEVVLKPLGPQLARVPGLVGATLLGKDQVVLVVNPLQWCATARLPRMHSGLVAARNAALLDAAAHVLVVDDSLTVRRLTGRLLERAGYRVSSAKDGVEAMQQMQDEVPSLAVLDLEMPRMDGFELMRQMRANAHTANVPIIVVTSRLADKHRRRALETGASAFFGKPYPEDELLARVAELLSRSASVRAA